MRIQIGKQAYLLMAFLTLGVAAFSSVVNRTIDDENGDEVTGVPPTYMPPQGWAHGSECPLCGVQLDRNKTFGGTWHDTTAYPGALRTITAEFNGSAVYVFCAIVNQGFVKPGVTVLTQLTFAIDDVFVGEYHHIPTDAKNALYQVPVYTNRTLDHGPHVIVITIAPDPTTQFPSLMLFDYITYTTTDSGSTGSRSNASVLPTSASYGLGSPGLGSETVQTIHATVPGTKNTTTLSSGPARTGLPSDSHMPVALSIAGGAAGGVIVLVTGVLLFRLFHGRGSKQRASSQKIQDGEPEPLDLRGILPSIRNAAQGRTSLVTHTIASVSSNRCESMDSFGPQSRNSQPASPRAGRPHDPPKSSSATPLTPARPHPRVTSRIYGCGGSSYQRVSALLENTFRRFIAIERRLGMARALPQYQVEKLEIARCARGVERAV